jgi:glucose/mannose transport system permease protein
VALIPVIIAASWQMIGYTMAMYLAGLRGVPEELREAARVDGATEVGIYRHIILPILQPITLSALIVLGHISLKIFDLIYTMTGKGPAFATDVPGIFMFETTFQGNHYAQGAAISIVMLLMVALVIIPYLIYSLKREVEL